MSEIEIGKRYKLFAPWHPSNGQMVEVIKQRKGVSESFHGQEIYHVAFNPGNPSLREEDTDSEFLAIHLKDPKEKMTEAPLEEYLDEKGLGNAQMLKERGIDCTLFRDESGDHYLEIKFDGKSDLVKIEDYDGLKGEVAVEEAYEKSEAVEDDEEEEGSGPQGPPNPDAREREGEGEED